MRLEGVSASAQGIDAHVSGWWQPRGCAGGYREPERLRLTHFGEATPAAPHLGAARESLAWPAQLARGGDRDAFLAEVGARIDDQPDSAAESMRAAMPAEQVWMGLERYWRKRGVDGSAE